MTTPLHAPIRPQSRSIAGISIRCAESEKDQTRGADALLLSPWPESVYAFERTWSRLAEHAHLVAIDLPSLRPSERGEALMTPRAMGEFVVRAADAFGLEHPHVVGPDIGTSTALFAAALNPGRMRSLVIGSGSAAVPLQLGDVLREWVESPDVQLFRRVGHVDGRQIVTAAIRGLERYAPSDGAREDYLSAYAAECFAESMRYLRDYSAELLVLRDLLLEIPTPVLIIAGRQDPFVPLANAEFLLDRLPESKLAVVEAGHVTWQDAAEEYAALVTSWWDGGYAAGRDERQAFRSAVQRRGVPTRLPAPASRRVREPLPARLKNRRTSPRQTPRVRSASTDTTIPPRTIV